MLFIEKPPTEAITPFGAYVEDKADGRYCMNIVNKLFTTHPSGSLLTESIRLAELDLRTKKGLSE
jgi:hypothetical protein